MEVSCHAHGSTVKSETEESHPKRDNRFESIKICGCRKPRTEPIWATRTTDTAISPLSTSTAANEHALRHKSHPTSNLHEAALSPGYCLVPPVHRALHGKRFVQQHRLMMITRYS